MLSHGQIKVTCLHPCRPWQTRSLLWREMETLETTPSPGHKYVQSSVSKETQTPCWQCEDSKISGFLSGLWCSVGWSVILMWAAFSALALMSLVPPVSCYKHHNFLLAFWWHNKVWIKTNQGLNLMIRLKFQIKSHFGWSSAPVVCWLKALKSVSLISNIPKQKTFRGRFSRFQYNPICIYGALCQVFPSSSTVLSHLIIVNIK